MPCEDTASSISIIINSRDELAGYNYEKITCSKPVGGAKNYLRFAAGKKIEELAVVEFEAVLDALKPEDREDEFLIYLEWRAIREGLRQYMGLPGDYDSESARIAEIINGPDETRIELIIFPPENMPAPLPCHEQDLKRQ